MGFISKLALIPEETLGPCFKCSVAFYKPQQVTKGPLAPVTLGLSNLSRDPVSIPTLLLPVLPSSRRAAALRPAADHPPASLSQLSSKDTLLSRPLWRLWVPSGHLSCGFQCVGFGHQEPGWMPGLRLGTAWWPFSGAEASSSALPPALRCPTCPWAPLAPVMQCHLRAFVPRALTSGSWMSKLGVASVSSELGVRKEAGPRVCRSWWATAIFSVTLPSDGKSRDR